ncbi:MAG TPA: esterase-like activity of phytase family protein [Crenalkalicoccus sp.]|nr:esterase-like activity of phytase family protein [Crenalkalicoccus sp.]
MPTLPPRALARRAVLGAAATLLGGSACGARSLAQPLALPAAPGAAMEPLGALALDDRVLGFGGLSALHLDPDLTITAVSDLAHWMTARLVLDATGRPVGLEGLRTGPLRNDAGRPLARGYFGDSESLARLPDGTWLVGFERWHRIRAYATLDGPGRYVAAPEALEQAPANGGLESLTVLADGRWLLLAEAYPPEGAPTLRRGWIGTPGAWTPIAYRPAPGLDPVDAAPLPDGSALVLERGFTLFGGFAGRLVRLPRRALAAAGAGTVLEGEALLDLAPPLPAENYEGVAAARVGERTLVAMVSDDNENPLQRSLLLVFAMAE